MNIHDLLGFERKQFDELKRAHDMRKDFTAMKEMSDLVKLTQPAMQPIPPIPPPKVMEFMRVRSAEELNDYASSGVLLRALQKSYNRWAATLDEETQPVIYAFLSNGSVVQVNELIEQGFHGIEIYGNIGGAPCLLLQHQNSLQFLCVAEPVTPEQPKRIIGFHLRKAEQPESSIDE